MKRLQGFVLGVIITALVLGSVPVFAENISVLFNNINIMLNGEKVASAGDSYKLANGDMVPFSILYKGTTYLPMRKVAELLDKDVTWDGTTSTAGINNKIEGIKLPSNKFSRLNPAPIGSSQTITVSNYSEEYTTQITIKDTIRGNEAWPKIQAANMFNDAPDIGKEYILATIHVKVISSKDDKSVDIGTYKFDLFNELYAEYDEYISVVEPTPQFRSSLYEGAEYEGYSVFQVSIDDKNPMIRFGADYNGVGGIWFKLNR